MYLLDTDTIVYALNGVPEVIEQFERHADSPMGLSIISYGELFYGAMKSAKQGENLAKTRRVGELYPVFDVTRAVVETYGEQKAHLEKQGHRLDDFDLLIASTALMLGYRLVTNNERHFKRIEGLDVENWNRKQK